MKKFLAGVVVGLLLSGVGVLGLKLTRSEQVASFAQPSTVSYGDGSIHTAMVWHIRSYGEPVVGTDHYEVVLGQDPSGNYGHRIRLEATGADMSELTVRWEPEAAVIVYASGYEVRVPAEKFIGGR